MFAPIAQALAKVLQRFLVPTKMQAVLHKESISGGAAIDPAPAEGVVAILTAPDLALRGGVSAASKVKPHTTAYIEVLAVNKEVVLKQTSLQPWFLRSVTPVITGKVKSTTQKLMGKGLAQGRVLVPAGIWTSRATGESYHVVATIAASLRNDGAALSLKDINDAEVRPVACLVLAKVLAHLSGYSTVEDLTPLLDGSGDYATGALLAKQLHPPEVSGGKCTMTRQEALQQCRSVETKAEEALRKSAAQAAEGGDQPLSTKLEEWAGQITTTDLKDVPNDLLTRMPAFDDPKLLFILFSFTAQLTKTDAFEPPMQPSTTLQPQCFDDLLEPDTYGDLPDLELVEDSNSDFYDDLWSGDFNAQQLAKRRPQTVCWGLERTTRLARGIIWDVSGSRPTPVDFSSTPQSKIRLDLWLDRFADCEDQQLVSHLKHGVCSMADQDFTAMIAPPLLSMAEGLHSIEQEIDRLVEQGYLREHSCCPTWPVLAVPNGAVPKKGSEVWRRISDHGHPHTKMVTDALRPVVPPNKLLKWKLKLPRELNPMHQDVAVDISILRYKGDLLGWSLVQFSDDMRDWFYQVRQHASQYWRSTFIFKRKNATRISYFQEVVMGMGYAHTSNIAQRFSITILILWYEEFERLDSEFLEQECATNSTLSAMLAHRASIPAHKTQQRQDRLHTGHFFTDDFTALILEPPHHSRLSTAITAWHVVTTKYNILTAVPRKRSVGASIPWTGIIFIACLGLLVLPQEKVLRIVAWLTEAMAGTIVFRDYEKVAGLISFARFALNLPKGALNKIFSPMQRGAEKDQGAAQRIRNTKDRVKVWELWTQRVLSAHGAPANWAIENPPDTLGPSHRVVVWHQDAAIEGTEYPALGAYAHGMYWIMPLERWMLEVLTIAPLELLANLGSLIIFGGPMSAPSDLAKYSIPIQSDSLTSTWRLQSQHGKSEVMSFIHNILVTRQEYEQLQTALCIGQVYREGNPLADNLSRGDMNLFFHTCRLLGVKPRRLQVPAIFQLLVQKTCEHAKQRPAAVL